MSLSVQQMLAVCSRAPITLCNAAAGSGKTRVLVERIRNLIGSGIQPERICAVTFTSVAAKEVQRRLGSHIGHIGTLHSLLLRVLRDHHQQAGLPREVSVLTEEEADAMLLACAGDIKCKASMAELKRCLSAALKKEDDSMAPAKVAAREFLRRMRESGDLSYDALLGFGLKLARSHHDCFPFEHLLVDEFQDSGWEDYEIYKEIRASTKFYVGDRRQAIYGFRGADSAAFDDVSAKEGACLLSIDTNYRSATSVVAAANRLFPGQIPKDGAHEGSVRVVHCASEASEVGMVLSNLAALPEDCTAAVLVRTNRSADRWKQALAQFLPPDQQRPQDHIGQRLGIALLRAMASPHNDSALLKLVKVLSPTQSKKLADRAQGLMTSVSLMVGAPDLTEVVVVDTEEAGDLLLKFESGLRRRGVVELPSLRDECDWLRQVAGTLPLPATVTDLLLAAYGQRETEPPRGKVFVGTVHSAKGLEFDHVFLPGFEDEVWPGNKDGKELEEERRVAYVAVTRAKLTCTLSCVAERKNEFKTWRMEPRTLSRFGKEMGL